MGLLRALAEERSAEVTRLAAAAARAMGCGDAGLEAAEKALRRRRAGCKSIVCQRLRQAGVHRTTDGAAAISALRCAKASSQWEARCNAPHTQTRTA
jgi:hypothetical protein